ncbi:nickel pincer cofactor biosynthesis protein LarB [Desulfomonile tiedjei]|uniref:NCAIR mutase-like protein n=1 Tax=Desulfomonile tiedjei (strain ATCC 49306 / DSM 6799 / DCB-1) TaxID=706587 RepID=I4CE02_DESTA|nr:nickel pincer cofactor biosynthesis protein LarB [Desulfomonile tiedjei]AFM27793.1 NCAIR mutase-like protein [Desulfomonile tiedjei DSM 6799]
MTRLLKGSDVAISVGVNETEKCVGGKPIPWEDVAFQAETELTSATTPVSHDIGAATISILMNNSVRASKTPRIADERLLKILSSVRSGEICVEEAYETLKDMPFEDLTHTKIDHHRAVRKGLHEVIFGQGKTVDQMTDIIRAMRQKNLDVLVTRVRTDAGEALLSRFPEGVFSKDAGCFFIRKDLTVKGKGTILVISAGTSDIKVAEEAYITSTFFGNTTEKLYDVGVAGIHRLFQHLETLKKARVIIVAAGMEGALPSVVAGVVSAPVIAVPTSVGYGASFGGLTALLAMLNSCATVSVMNIDNGFGASYFATLINRL